MEEKQLLFQFEDKQIVQNLLENINDVIKDTDATEEKEKVKSFLQKVSDAICFVGIGEEQVGKSSFLNTLFEGCLSREVGIKPTIGIQEIRSGAEALSFQVDTNHQRVFLTEPEMVGISIVDIQGINKINDIDCKEKIKAFIDKSDVLFVVLAVDKINSLAVWDFLEKNNGQKMIFILTKCDLISKEEIEKNKVRLSRYMQEAEITAPIFCVSSLAEKEGNTVESGFEEIRMYVRKNIIGENPVLVKQSQNLNELKLMLKELSDSFSLRKRQYEADAAILQQLNKSIDTFCINSVGTIDGVKNVLKAEINREIDNYQQEVINKLAPHRIKEIFGNEQSNFANYLELLNKSYQERMTANVNRITQEAVCRYLNDLENVFEEATGYFKKRESLLKLEDRFYGTMAESKKTQLEHISRGLVETQSYYTTLTGASEELFMKLWRAREEYDYKVARDTSIGKVAGGISGGALGTTAIVTTIKTGAAVSKLVYLWPVIGVVAGGILIGMLAKKLSSAKNMMELEEKATECIEIFKKEIGNIRNEMTTQILDTIDTMFKRELGIIDQMFVEYRMSVNIDSKNIPVLEEKMKNIENLMDKIEKMEERLLSC